METTYKHIEVGADRFLALEWVNFAFELNRKQNDEQVSYQILREYLDQQIKGKESSRKTANQIKRLWLYQDQLVDLRKKSLELPYPINPELMSILHLGMAVNVFPVYNETAKAISILSGFGERIPKQSVVKRVMETFATPSAIPRSVIRVMQTLQDWRLIRIIDQDVTLTRVTINDSKVAAWLLMAAMVANRMYDVPFQDLSRLPQFPGTEIADLRMAINSGSNFSLQRDNYGMEIVRMRRGI